VEWPSVTVVCVCFNRRGLLRTVLTKTLRECDYPGELDAIVIDNASSDGTPQMVRAEFPAVHLIVREDNIGAPAWNQGFAAAKSDYVLILDDDCYLPPDGLRRAVAAAGQYDADLVSFKVVSSLEPGHVFTDAYPTGLIMFWGCAALVRRQVVQELGGYDPQMFIWANELEFTMRFYDRGYRHLHFPCVVAQHMKLPSTDEYGERGNALIHARNHAYVAGKLLRGRDAAAAVTTVAARGLASSLLHGGNPIEATWSTLRGCTHGMRHRDPLRKAAVSRFYRRNFEAYTSPWSLMAGIDDLARALLPASRATALATVRSAAVLRREAFFQQRRRLYPNVPAALKF
jgi:GT2 family glycosyltransferase